jgi:hypothetical protein
MKIQSTTKKLLKIYESHYLSYEEEHTLEERINRRILKLHEITEFFKKIIWMTCIMIESYLNIYMEGWEL